MAQPTMEPRLMTGLAMLMFLTPWWAAGAVAAIGLPLIAHLLSKSRYREVVFPATRFIQQATQQTTRIEKPRSLLLMLLRMLLLALVVLAFMQPRWLASAEAGDTDQGVSWIILLDASASMQRVDQGATLHERAVREAGRLIAKLDPARDVASVIWVDGQPAPLLPEPTANLTLLREALSATNPSYHQTNWPAAVAAADRLAEQGDRAVRVVVISDQQGDRPSLEEAGDRLRRAPIQHIKIDGPTNNTAVRLLDVRPYPVTAGRPVAVTAELTHFGETSRTVTLKGELDDGSVAQRIELAPGGRQTVTLDLATDATEPVLLRLSIEGGDAIASDDRSVRLLDVQTREQVLIVHRDSAAARSFAGRVASMVNPRLGDRNTGLPEVTLIAEASTGDALQTADAEQPRAVIVLEQPVALSNPARVFDRLDPFMERGGGVVHLMPLDAGTASTSAATTGQIDFALAPLRVYEGPARAGLAQLTWPGVAARAELNGAALLKASDGRAIIADQPRGRGRVITVNADLTTTPGGLLAEPAFVVLFNELWRYASPGMAIPAARRPGDALPTDLRDASNLTRPQQAKPGTQTITAPGAYLLRDADGRVIAGVAAELDPEESDTGDGAAWDVSDESAANDVAAAALSRADASFNDAAATELWPYLALGALLIVGCESLLLGRFALAQGGEA